MLDISLQTALKKDSKVHRKIKWEDKRAARIQKELAIIVGKLAILLTLALKTRK